MSINLIKKTNLLNISMLNGMTTRPSGSSSLPPIVSTPPGTINATYATALAAVSDGQSFGVPTADNSRLYVYLRVSSTVGTLTSVQPYTTPGRTTIDTMASLTQNLPLPLSPLVDIDTADMFYSTRSVRNRAPGGVNSTLNLLEGYSYQGFQNGGAGNTVTGRQADRNSGTQAIRVTWAGNVTAATNYHNFATRVPAGQWTFWAWVRTHPGATNPNINVTIGANFKTGLVSFPITSSWTRISGTAVLRTTEATANLIIGNDTDALAADIDITEINMYPGTVDPGTSNQGIRIAPFSLSVDVGFNGTSELHSAGVGANNANQLIIPLPTTTTYNSWSAAWLLNVVDGNALTATMLATNNIAGTLQRLVGNYWASDNGQTVRGVSVGQGFTGIRGDAIAGAGKMVFGMVCDATGVYLYHNGVQVMFNAVGVFPLTSIENLTIHGYTGAGGIAATLPYFGDTAAFGFWNAALTPAQMLTVQTTMAGRASAHGWTLIDQKNVVYAEGDSISQGFVDQVPSSTPGYEHRAFALYTGIQPAGNVQAVSGSGLKGGSGNYLTVRQAVDIAAITALVAAGKNVIFSFLIGSNDHLTVINQAAADQYWTDLKTYMDAFRAVGAKVVYCTQIADGSIGISDPYDNLTTGVIPSGPLTGNTYTGWKGYLRGLALNDATHYDALCDLQGSAFLVTNQAGANSTYWNADLRHPNSLGHSVIAPIYAAAVQTLLI
jgi:hypothetical protein